LERIYTLIYNEKDNIFENLDFNFTFEFEKDDNIFISLNHLSLGNDVEKMC
jgi:hypothetical protein